MCGVDMIIPKILDPLISQNHCDMITQFISLQKNCNIV